MKRKLLIQGGLAMAVLVVLAFGIGVGQAYATTGCFTDTIGHPFETYICWMLENGITSGTAPGIYSPNTNVTRGQMAVFMQRLDNLTLSQTNAALSTGDFYINAGPSQWVANAFTSGTVDHYTANAYLKAPGVGDYYFMLSPTLPASVYNHKMYLSGVKVCYDANDNAGFITQVDLQHFSGGAVPIIYNEIIDNTNRIDATCSVFSMASPGSIWGSDTITLAIVITSAAPGNSVRITNVSFILVPSSSPGTLQPETGERPTLLDMPLAPDGSSGINP